MSLMDSEVEVDSPHSAFSFEGEGEYWTDDGTENDSEWEELCDKQKRRLGMKGLEAQEAGPADKTGVQRGKYSVTGSSHRSTNRKKKEAADRLAAGTLSEWQYAIEIDRLERMKQGNNMSEKTQRKLGSFFPSKRPPPTPPESEPEPATKRARTSNTVAPSKDETTPGIELQLAPPIEIQDSHTPPSNPPDEPLPDEGWSSDSEHEDTEDVQVAQFTAPDVPLIITKLKAMQKVERKGSNHRALHLISSLIDFYERINEVGRMRSAHEASNAIGRGVSFARKLRSQAN